MHFKLIIAFVDEDKTDQVVKAVRKAGATVIGNARGEGLKPATTFFGLSLEAQREILLFLVERHLSRQILDTISRTAQFDTAPGTGIAVQLDVEDAVGVSHQIKKLKRIVEENLLRSDKSFASAT